MAENSNIAWTDNTFNPWIGCTKVSPGCANCYAEELDKNRFSKTLGGATKEKPVSHWGKGAPRVLTSEANWKQPLKWNREAQPKRICTTCGLAYHNSWETDRVIAKCPGCESKTSIRFRPRVFCASLADWLDDEVPGEWLFDLLSLILRKTPNLDWLLLTKRPENFASRMKAAIARSHCDPMDVRDLIETWLDGNYPKNVWVGTTVENQEQADKRIPHLLDIPAKVRFLSCEPLLSDLKLEGLTCPSCGYAKIEIGIPLNHQFCKNKGPGIHWVIGGGESGKVRREMNLDWLRSLHDQCQAAGVPFFCKQDSALKPGQRGRIPDELWKQEFPK